MLIITFFYGLLLGSFYNVVGLRVPNGESIVKPRSHCPKCGHVLSPLELVPVLSYVFLRGRCRCCKAPVSLVYPLVELLTGLLFVAAPLLMGWTLELIIAWTLISLVVIVFVTDIKYMLIPDKILLVFAIILVIERIFIPLAPWWDSIAGAAVGFGLLLFIAVISKGGMGGGDIKLYAVLGLALGVKFVLLSFFIATLCGAVFGGIGLLSGKLKRGNPIPFGPFIGIGALAAYFFGNDIITWYLHSLL